MAYSFQCSLRPYCCTDPLLHDCISASQKAADPQRDTTCSLPLRPDRHNFSPNIIEVTKWYAVCRSASSCSKLLAFMVPVYVELTVKRLTLRLAGNKRKYFLRGQCPIMLGVPATWASFEFGFIPCVCCCHQRGGTVHIARKDILPAGSI